MYSRDELFLRLLECYFGLHFVRRIASQEISTKINLLWSLKPFLTLVHTLLLFMSLMDQYEYFQRQIYTGYQRRRNWNMSWLNPLWVGCGSPLTTCWRWGKPMPMETSIAGVLSVNTTAYLIISNMLWTSTGRYSIILMVCVVLYFAYI